MLAVGASDIGAPSLCYQWHGRGSELGVVALCSPLLDDVSAPSYGMRADILFVARRRGSRVSRRVHPLVGCTCHRSRPKRVSSCMRWGGPLHPRMEMPCMTSFEKPTVRNIDVNIDGVGPVHTPDRSWFLCLFV